MNLQETIIQLNELKLRGMSSSFEAMTSLPVQNRPSLVSGSAFIPLYYKKKQ